MQKLTPDVVTQLNNLPGFPAIPNTAPPTSERWILGDWLVECHVQPEVANVASLPLTDNRVGDVRVSLADQLWYIWDGAAWQSMAGGGGAVASVGALAPISSSGGVNPVISLTGVVAAANGGTGLAASGALGNVLTSDGVGGWVSSASVATSPSAPFDSVQFNNAGTFGGSANLTYNSGTSTLGSAAALNLEAAADSTWNVTGANLTLSTTGGGPGRDVTIQSGNEVYVNAGGAGDSVIVNGPYSPTNFQVRDQNFGSQPAFFVDGSAGFVGLKTSTPASLLSVGATSQFQVDSSGDIVAIRGQTTTFPAANAAGALTNDGVGNLSWAAAPSGSLTVGTTAISSGTVGSVLFEGAGNVLQESGNLFWDNTGAGKLGIGTNTPAFPLDVQGNVAGAVNSRVYNASSGAGAFASVRAYGNTANAGAIVFGFGSANGNTQFQSISLNDAAAFTTDTGVSRLFISTRNATAPIHIGTNSDFNGPRAIEIAANQGNVIVNPDGAGGVDLSVLGFGSTNALYVDASASAVGIGTNAPSRQLEVAANAAGGVLISGNVADKRYLEISNTTAGAGSSSVMLRSTATQYLDLTYTGYNYSPSGAILAAQTYFLTAGTGGLLLGTFNAGAGVGDVVFVQNGTATTNERFRISASEVVVNDAVQPVNFRVEGQSDANLLFTNASTNYVGIGNNSPAAKLDVRGVPVVDGDNRSIFNALDSTALAANTGAGIALGGVYTSGGAYAAWAGIVSRKDNATDGDYAGSLTFISRASGGSPTERMRITSAGNVGVNETAPPNRLTVAGSFGPEIDTTAVSPTTLDDTHYTMLCDTSGGAITVNLPAASTCARRVYVVKNIDVNAVTVQANGAETIDGANTYSLAAQWDHVMVQSNGTAWFVIG